MTAAAFSTFMKRFTALGRSRAAANGDSITLQLREQVVDLTRAAKEQRQYPTLEPFV